MEREMEEECEGGREGGREGGALAHLLFYSFIIPLPFTVGFGSSSSSSSSERGQIYLVTPSLPPSLPSSSSPSFVLSPHTSPNELAVRTFSETKAAVEFLVGGGGLLPFQVGREGGKEGGREGGWGIVSITSYRAY